MEIPKNKNQNKNPPNGEEDASEVSSLANITEALDASYARASSRKESDSESDSSLSGVSIALRHKKDRGVFKRPRLEPSSNEQEAPAPKIPTAARGRGKGKGSTRAAGSRSEPAERLAAEGSALGKAAPSDSSEMEASGGEGSVGGAESLRLQVKEALRMLAGQKTQAGRNGVLKHAEAAIMSAVSQPGSAERQMAAMQKELAGMRRELSRLVAANTALEAELRAAKTELAAARGVRSQPAQPAEADLLGLMRREMAAFQQRFDVLEGRLLRPPLAAGSYAAAAAKPKPPTSRPSVRRVAFRARLKEPIDHHRRGPKGLMFSRGCGVGNAWLRLYPLPKLPEESVTSVILRCALCQLGLCSMLVIWTVVWVFVIHSFEGPYEIKASKDFDKEQNFLVIKLATELRQVSAFERV
ncbi:unnamed protein product [Spodoptera exigua]|nr:unnamed protein product [Spodoptera exigua]